MSASGMVCAAGTRSGGGLPAAEAMVEWTPMPIKPPKPKEPEPELPVSFVDELVRRSLDVNPHLRQGLDTHQYLNRLKKELVDSSKPAPAGGPAAPARP